MCPPAPNLTKASGLMRMETDHTNRDATSKRAMLVFNFHGTLLLLEGPMPAAVGCRLMTKVANATFYITKRWLRTMFSAVISDRVSE